MIHNINKSPASSSRAFSFQPVLYTKKPGISPAKRKVMEMCYNLTTVIVLNSPTVVPARVSVMPLQLNAVTV